ncbi:MAG: LysM peptidoglycan-binding domain-containing protein [Verrucomicrobia bacterium]|nr:MAG: LysM peptidoglycan-binding domain-containing protein [Verrucomicrobiota bacterium]
MKSILRMAVGLALAGWVAGCGEGVSFQDRRDERDPFLQRARERRNAEDLDGAIKLYNEALDRKPQLASAHLEVGLLYVKKEDYLRAIYHYQRNIELRPAAQKRDLVEGLIREARLYYAAALPNRPPGAIEEIALLKKEIATLRAQLEGTNAAPKASVVLPVSNAAPRSLAPPQPVVAQPAVRTHLVQPGETLAAIAVKEYKSRSKWRKIFEANRDALTSPESVRAGQTLVLPP